MIAFTQFLKLYVKWSSDSCTISGVIKIMQFIWTILWLQQMILDAYWWPNVLPVALLLPIWKKSPWFLVLTSERFWMGVSYGGKQLREQEGVFNLWMLLLESSPVWSEDLLPSLKLVALQETTPGYFSFVPNIRWFLKHLTISGRLQNLQLPGIECQREIKCFGSYLM